MTEPIKMIEIFSGIGAQAKALDNLPIPHEVVATMDVDKEAIVSYASMRYDLEKEIANYEFPSKEAMVSELQLKNVGFDFVKQKHSITMKTNIDKVKLYYISDKLSKNLGDVSLQKELPYVDIVFHSSPCQDYSCAGKGAGGDEGSETRSSLMWESLRLIGTSMPRFIVWENVAAVLSGKHRHNFLKYLERLSEMGYESAFELLNSKNYGVPQNRLRIFCVSRKIEDESNRDTTTRECKSSNKQVINTMKEIRENHPNIKIWEGFTFPEPIPLTTRLKDILEHNVDEKYYLPDDRIEKILNSSFMQEKKRIQTTDVCDTLLARDWKDPKCVPVEEEPQVKQIGNVCPTKTRPNPNQGRVYDKDGIAPALTTMEGGNREPMVIDEIRVVGNYMPSNHDASRVVDVDGIAPTVKENHGTVTAIAEPFIVASRGRNPENPSDRTAGIKTEQRFEPNKEGICNCITSVQKDSYVVEPQIENKPRVYPGARFGRLVAKRDTGEKQGTNHIWECDCDCGNTCYVNTGRLGITTNSCGCLKIDSHRTHNMSKTRLYNIWRLMKGCCFNEKSSGYKNYGARGITVCDEWLKFENFYEWAINNGYREDLTIERKNNDGNYEPSNCKWADLTTQVNNRRNWGEVEYYGIVKDNTGYRAQVTVNGEKIYIAHSTNDIEYLVNERNKYIDEHNLPNKKNVFKKLEDIELEPIIYDDYDSCISDDKVAIVEDQFPGSRDARIYKEYSPTLRQNCGGLQVAKCEDEPEINPKLVGGIGEKNFGKQYRQGNRVYDSDEIAMALNAQPVGNVGGYSYLYAVEEKQPKIRWRIRKLTPKETTRLMNFTDKDYEAMAKYVSNSAIYKANGNSIVVSCLIAIFSSLFLEDGYKSDVWTKYSLNYWD